ncbi:MAG: RNA polymerase sigma factor (sigma-70 family) [Parvicella sp.]|jgi:RNA polymerase sigma factor (sigma-70 family)
MTVGLNIIQKLTRTEYNSTVKSHSTGIFRYAFKWTRCEQDAKDLVQDIFSKLWINRKSVEFAKAKSWLFTSMHNALVNFSKKKNEITSIEDATYLEPRLDQPNLGLKDLISQVLSQLPEIQRSVVILRDSEGYSYEEIGSILNLTEAQVKVYLFRARQKVKNQLVSLEVLVA